MDVILTDDISVRSYFGYFCLQNLFKYGNDQITRNLEKFIVYWKSSCLFVIENDYSSIFIDFTKSHSPERASGAIIFKVHITYRKYFYHKSNYRLRKFDNLTTICNECRYGPTTLTSA